jgi:hypothetical protein
MPHVGTMLVPGAGHDVMAAAQAALTERILKFLLE